MTKAWEHFVAQVAEMGCVSRREAQAQGTNSASQRRVRSTRARGQEEDLPQEKLQLFVSGEGLQGFAM